MADWNNPLLTSLYTDVLSILKARDVDAGSLCYAAPTNPPTGLLRYNRTSKAFEEWSGAAWVVIPVAVAGGGTGATTAAGARTNLGIGSLGTQANNAVNITGGTISGITSLSMSGAIIVGTDNAYDIGTDAARHRYVYIKSGLALPVGADKWIPA